MFCVITLHYIVKLNINFNFVTLDMNYLTSLACYYVLCKQTVVIGIIHINLYVVYEQKYLKVLITS